MFAGKMQSGKSTSSKLLRDMLKEKGHKVEILALADELKQMCQEAFKPLAKILKDKFNYDLVDENWWENKNEISRCLLQIVGSDIVRTVDVDYWCRKLKEKIEKSDAEFFILQDWRFNTEYNFFVQSVIEQFCINVERPGLNSGDAGKHVSENDLNDFKNFDLKILNCGDMTDLENTIEDAIDKILYWHDLCSNRQTPKGDAWESYKGFLTRFALNNNTGE
jgi:dephospho-CoA kinase